MAAPSFLSGDARKDHVLNFCQLAEEDVTLGETIKTKIARFGVLLGTAPGRDHAAADEVEGW
jgi:hypothetical protein